LAAGDRTDDEPAEMVVGPEHTKTDTAMTMYFHSPRQVDDWVAANGRAPLRSLAFTVSMNRERTRSLRARAYAARKGVEARPSPGRGA
jgi:hypothetical protein